MKKLRALIEGLGIIISLQTILLLFAFGWYKIWLHLFKPYTVDPVGPKEEFLAGFADVFAFLGIPLGIIVVVLGYVFIERREVFRVIKTYE